MLRAPRRRPLGEFRACRRPGGTSKEFGCGGNCAPDQPQAKRYRRRIFPGDSVAQPVDVKPSCLKFPLTHCKQARDSPPPFAWSFRCFRYPSISRTTTALCLAGATQPGIACPHRTAHREESLTLPQPPKNRAEIQQKAPPKILITLVKSMRNYRNRPQSKSAPRKPKDPRAAEQPDHFDFIAWHSQGENFR